MAWWVKPLERKNADGTPSGLWHLCAESDEGGGFYAGCDHDHPSAEEAEECLDAKIRVGQVTGFPLRQWTVTINGAEAKGWGDKISHEEICKLANKPVEASVTYRGPRKGDSERSGMTYAGKVIEIEDGMIFSCYVTGNA